MNKLKTIFGISLVQLIIVLGMFPVSADNNKEYINRTYTMEQASGFYKTQGRTGLKGTGLTMDWSGAGIEFNADCEGNIAFNLKVQSSFKSAYFTLFVDGMRMNRFEVKTSSEKTEDVKLEIASKLLRGKHTIGFFNDTECTKANVSIEFITICGNLTQPPKNNDLLIEFIGDSYLTGYDNIVNSETDGDILCDTPFITDGTLSLGVLTADNLQADYSILAVSGYGLVCGMDGLDSNMPKYYDYISWQRSHTESSDIWDFSRQPDIVIIELGDNDRYAAEDCGVSNDDFKEQTKEFLVHIRDKNSKAKIVWLMYGYENEINSTINELGGAKAGLYSTTLKMESGGGNGHPNVDELRVSAEQLTAYLKEAVLPTILTTTVFNTETTTFIPTNFSAAASNFGVKTGDHTHNTILWMSGIIILLFILAVILWKKKTIVK